MAAIARHGEGTGSERLQQVRAEVGLSERVLRDLNQLIERAGVRDGQVGEDLPVQTHVGPLEAVYEPAVLDGPHSCRSVDTQYPEPSEIPLSESTMDGGEPPRAHEGLLGRAKRPAATAPVASRRLHYAFPTVSPGRACCGSHRLLGLSRMGWMFR